MFLNTESHLNFFAWWCGFLRSELCGFRWKPCWSLENLRLVKMSGRLLHDRPLNCCRVTGSPLPDPMGAQSSRATTGGVRRAARPCWWDGARPCQAAEAKPEQGAQWGRFLPHPRCGCEAWPAPNPCSTSGKGAESGSPPCRWISWVFGQMEERP